MEPDPFADSPTTYFVQFFAPIAVVQKDYGVLGMYLLDLMREQGYRVVSGVRFEFDEPVIVPFPPGWCQGRVMVDVQEFDVEVRDGD